jgi:hypothetical protein
LSLRRYSPCGSSFAGPSSGAEDVLSLIALRLRRGSRRGPTVYGLGDSAGGLRAGGALDGHQAVVSEVGAKLVRLGFIVHYFCRKVKVFLQSQAISKACNDAQQPEAS